MTFPRALALYAAAIIAYLIVVPLGSLSIAIGDLCEKLIDYSTGVKA